MRALKRLPVRRRRAVAAILAGLAAACALSAVRAPRGVEVLAAARDLAGGRLAASDVMVVRLPPDAVPAGAYAAGSPVTGRVVAGPLRRGEPLTDARLLGPGLFRFSGSPESVATPVRIADPGAAGLLSPGDVIDVLAAYEEGPFEARTVAQQVRVIARPPGSTDGGGLLVLATTPAQAAGLAQAQAQGRLSVTIHPR
ncbi:Flp pilus assembly protein CpaB [Microbispora sp. NBC_01189]|uniref:Flp pilus assembly protein CpaB n=1 Tax=Microbispora sp. NBC_01189 TaxID=2903583 RepID=UPI002E160BAB|nr:Flp pilus assembly protein CpaB [Microbispora sp. NBC_01189]